MRSNHQTLERDVESGVKINKLAQFLTNIGKAIMLIKKLFIGQHGCIIIGTLPDYGASQCADTLLWSQFGYLSANEAHGTRWDITLLIEPDRCRLVWSIPVVI